MSSLILDPLLAGHLKLTDGHLTHTATNHLALCGEECVCDVPAVFPVCGCVSEDYGTIKSLGDLTITVSGSMTKYNASSPFCLATGSCASLNGTYVRPCSGISGTTTETWTIASYTCTSGSFDYYYLNQLEILYQPGPFGVYRVRVRMRSAKSQVPTGDPIPYTTLTTGVTFSLFGHVRVWDFNNTNPTHLMWTYVMGGACREECNFSTNYTKCPTATGSITWTTTTSQLVGVSPGADYCDLGGITVDGFVAAAT